MKVPRSMFALAIVFAAAAPRAWATGDLHGTIQARENQWSAAFNAGKAADVAAIYGENAVFVAPGSMPVRGRAEIGKVVPAFMTRIRDVKLTADEVRPLGSHYALEIGHTDYLSVAEDGKTSPAVDNYVVVWHQAKDGIWYYESDIFNSR